MFDDTDESPARLGWRRWRPRVSFSFLEASSRCVGIFLDCLDLVVVFGRKPRFGVDRHGGGVVLDVVSLLEASCKKTRLGGSRLLSSGV
jgi:hypothetical protein